MQGNLHSRPKTTDLFFMWVFWADFKALLKAVFSHIWKFLGDMTCDKTLCSWESNSTLWFSINFLIIFFFTKQTNTHFFFYFSTITGSSDIRGGTCDSLPGVHKGTNRHSSKVCLQLIYDIVHLRKEYVPCLQPIYIMWKVGTVTLLMIIYNSLILQPKISEYTAYTGYKVEIEERMFRKGYIDLIKPIARPIVV